MRRITVTAPSIDVKLQFPTPIITSFASLSFMAESRRSRHARDCQLIPGCSWISPTATFVAIDHNSIGLCIHSGRSRDVDVPPSIVNSPPDASSNRRHSSSKLRFNGTSARLNVTRCCVIQIPSRVAKKSSVQTSCSPAGPTSYHAFISPRPTDRERKTKKSTIRVLQRGTAEIKKSRDLPDPR